MCGGWSQNRISNYEADTRKPSTSACLKIAEVTGVRNEWLQLESGPMLADINQSKAAYQINPPIIDWDEIDSFIANPKSFDQSGKERALIATDNTASFGLPLKNAVIGQFQKTQIAVITPIRKGQELNNKEVLCRDKNTGEKAIRIYTTAFGAVSLVDPNDALPPIQLDQQNTIEIIGLVWVKYE